MNIQGMQIVKINIEFYLDTQANEPDKFTLFNSWREREGVIMPKCEFPAYFENGLLGVKVKEDIGHREAFLGVPN